MKLKNQKGFTLVELSVTIFLVSIVSVFIFQTYLFIHKRYLEWEKDSAVTDIIIGVSSSLLHSLKDISVITKVSDNSIEFVDVNGDKVTIYNDNGILRINKRAVLSNKALLKSLEFRYYSNNEPSTNTDIKEELKEIDYISYLVNFSFKNKLYSNKSGCALRKRGMRRKAFKNQKESKI